MLAVCWMLVILPCCMSSHAFPHRSPRGNKEEQPETPCPSNSSQEPVFVPCPNVTAEEVTFRLLKGENVVWQSTTQTQSNQSQLNVQLEHNNLNQNVRLNLRGACQGIYRCEGMITYPPPLQTVESNQTIVIVTEAPQCTYNKATKPPREESRRLWIWITAVSLLSVYSLAITIVAVVIWSKLQGADYQNDYMNTKPIAPLNRRKKKGQLTPIPRYI